ncbi:hypothetical protein [Micromonospora sp. DPT]|uniref:hypothetical protein n=1 Tax=Micromonospora sp. DPT TaxID=3142975 RepID=UPI00320A9091
MTYRNDPRYLDAQERYVAPMSDDETPDSSFARHVVAAYEMYLIQTGREVPNGITEAQALVAYSFLVPQPEPEGIAS